jgi:formate/nitrite transporter FocA (FNT family)
MLMTTAVTFARQKNILPLLFAVPLFIVCGFTHCVADAFYYMTIPFSSWSFELLGVYACTVLGNLIGCNLYRIVLEKDQYEQA